MAQYPCHRLPWCPLYYSVWPWCPLYYPVWPWCPLYYPVLPWCPLYYPLYYPVWPWLDLCIRPVTHAMQLYITQALASRLWPEFNRVYLTQGPPVPPASQTSTCGETPELKKGGHNLVLGCSTPGTRISEVVFASFGTPTGNCATGFGRNVSCDIAGMGGFVQKACVGETACTIVPTWSLYAKDDPCMGVVKTLAVQVKCNATQPPAPSQTRWRHAIFDRLIWPL